MNDVINAATGGNGTIEENEIFDAYHTTGIDYQVRDTSTAGTITMQRNRIYTTEGFTADSTGIFVLKDAGASLTKVKILYNLFYRLTGIAIQIKDGVVTDIYNNTGWQNARVAQVSSYFIDGTSVVTIKNNIEIDADPDNGVRANIEIVDTTNKVLDNNLWWQPTDRRTTRIGSTNYSQTQFATYQSAISPQEQNSLSVDPLFVDTANRDFRLQSGSPCVDAGTDVSLTTDFAGRSVPQQSEVDIGAIEFVGPLALVVV